jgi:hypothetical protein
MVFRDSSMMYLLLSNSNATTLGVAHSPSTAQRSCALLIQQKRDVDIHESLTGAEARSHRHLHPAAW